MSFNVSMLDDMFESNEDVSLTIDTDSLPDGIITGSPSEVMVVTRNNKSKCIWIAGAFVDWCMHVCYIIMYK